MNNLSGRILMSAPSIGDENFLKSVVFIAEHNANGALGFVVNKVFERALNDLEEFSSSPSFPLYSGGPVDKEHLYFIHKRNDLIPDGVLVTDNIYMGGDFKKVIACINAKSLTPADIKIFIGYCGWNIHELEAEIAEGSWILTDSNIDLIFGY